MKLKEYLDNNYTKKEQKTLTLLNCSDEGITSLEGIEQLVNLKELNCCNNKLTSLKGIEKLVNLEYLDCSHNNLTSLKGIENLDKLRYLYCHNNLLPYSNLYDLDKKKLEVIKEVRQYKIKKLLL